MTLSLFLYVVGTFIGLVITQELYHRYPRFALWFFVAISFILFPCWLLLLGAPDWFPWMKVASIALGITILSLFRTTRLGNTKICKWVVYLFLAINILEAVMRDAVAGTAANYLNALAGILLIATLTKISTIHIHAKGEHRDLHWSSMTLAWIIGYTLWNWVFVYLNFGFPSAAIHTAVLGSAFIVGFIDRERWLQARVFTLGTYFIMFHSVPHLGSSSRAVVTNEQFGIIIALVSFGFMLAYAIFLRSGYKATGH